MSTGIRKLVKSVIPKSAWDAHIERLRQRRRREFALGYYAPKLAQIETWLANSREDGNFTYNLTDRNKDYLAQLVGVVTGASASIARGYIDELDGDDALREHVRSRTAQSNYAERADPVQHYGRRLGWYAIARIAKPKVIVETGVEKGLGSCVLTSALIKNAVEGHPGRYYGTDIDPNAGYLFTAPYNEHGQILCGDSLESLGRLDEKIDLFINDSDHSSEYESREYALVASKLSENAIVLSDNAHDCDSLLRWSESSGRRFLFFAEEPLDHWYPGGGIGISF